MAETNDQRQESNNKVGLKALSVFVRINLVFIAIITILLLTGRLQPALQSNTTYFNFEEDVQNWEILGISPGRVLPGEELSISATEAFTGVHALKYAFRGMGHINSPYVVGQNDMIVAYLYVPENAVTAMAAAMVLVGDDGTSDITEVHHIDLTPNIWTPLVWEAPDNYNREAATLGLKFELSDQLQDITEARESVVYVDAVEILNKNEPFAAELLAAIATQTSTATPPLGEQVVFAATPTATTAPTETAASASTATSTPVAAVDTTATARAVTSTATANQTATASAAATATVVAQTTATANAVVRRTASAAQTSVAETRVAESILLSQTATAVAATTATAAVPTPSVLPPPALIYPKAEEQVAQEEIIRLEWVWVRPLQENEYFSVRVGSEEHLQNCFHTQVREPSIFRNVGDVCPSGTYFWEVIAVVNLSGDINNPVWDELSSGSIREEFYYRAPQPEPPPPPPPSSDDDDDDGGGSGGVSGG